MPPNTSRGPNSGLMRHPFAIETLPSMSNDQAIATSRTHILQSNHHLQPRQMIPPIDGNHSSIHVACCPTGQKHDQARNILLPAQPSVWRPPFQILQSSLDLDQPIGHLGREESWRNGITQDVSGPQINGQVPDEMHHSCLGGRVTEGCTGA